MVHFMHLNAKVQPFLLASVCSPHILGVPPLIGRGISPPYRWFCSLVMLWTHSVVVDRRLAGFARVGLVAKKASIQTKAHVSQITTNITPSIQEHSSSPSCSCAFWEVLTLVDIETCQTQRNAINTMYTALADSNLLSP